MLVKGLSKINKVRKFTIPGKIDRKTYDKLQKGKEADVLSDVGSYLINNGYAVLVEKPEKGAKKDG